MSELNLRMCPICHATASLSRQTMEMTGQSVVWYECRECGSVLLWLDGENQWAYQRIGRDEKSHLLKKTMRVSELQALLPQTSPEPSTLDSSSVTTPECVRGENRSTLGRLIPWLLALCVLSFLAFVAIALYPQVSGVMLASNPTPTLTATPGPTSIPEPTRIPGPTPTLPQPTATRTATPTFTLMPETATARANETVVATNASATAIAKAQTKRTATAEARAQAGVKATAAIEAYRTTPPEGYWEDQSQGIRIRAGNFRYFPQTNRWIAGPGAKFVAMGFAVLNESGDTFAVNPFGVTLVDLDGWTYEYDIASYDYWSNPLEAVDLEDGSQTNGGLVFRIRQHSGPAQVIFEVPGRKPSTRIVIDLRRPPDDP